MPPARQHLTNLNVSLQQPPSCHILIFSLSFVLCTDASDVVSGGILSQYRDGHKTVICYLSRQLTKAEKNYSTVEREALAAVSVIKEFYLYLYGFSFTLVTDHNPLTSLKGLKILLAAWPGGWCIFSNLIFKWNINLEEYAVMLMHCHKDLALSQ